MSTAAELAEKLRDALDAIDSGEVEATDVQRAYIAGAVGALDMIGELPTSASLRDTNV